jgi:hypothetical protein
MNKKTDRNAEMVKMRESGATYTEIAKRFGISRCRVWQMVGRDRGFNFRPLSPERCVYPNLRKWMNENKITKAELTRRMRGNATSGNVVEIDSFLSGKIEGMAKKTIDKLILVTGLPYEALFSKEETASCNTVALVRCKECGYGKLIETQKRYLCRKTGGCLRFADDFCNYGTKDGVE